MNIRGFISFAALSFAALTISSCSDKGDSTYVGGDFIGFADTSLLCPVFEDEDATFEVGIAATQAVDYDRDFAVEVVPSKSSAIEGVHYSLPNYSFTIPAGQTKSSVSLQGVWDNFEPTDSVGVHLRLVMPEKYVSNLNPETQDVAISFLKVCDFDINQFEGYAILTSSFLYDLTNSFERLVEVEIDDKAENTIIVKNIFTGSDIYRDNYDLRLKFNTDNPLAPKLEMENGQIVYSVRTLLGGIVGDGWLRAQMNDNMLSQYNVCQGFALFYLDLYAAGEGGGMYGSGYMNVLEWISDEEAEIIIRDGFGK